MKTTLQKINNLRPELQVVLEKNILNFWQTYSVDNVNGGFTGLIDENNIAVKEAGKGAVLNARILWTFSAAAAFFDSKEYGLLADRAYQYITSFFLDKKYGGVYWELDFKGNPLNRRKQIYAQAFTIYSCAEYLKISSNEESLKTAIKIYNLTENYSLDKLKGGYFEAFGEDWSGIPDLRLSKKDLNAPKTMNTHLHILEAYTNLYSVWKDEGLRQSLKSLVSLFLEKFFDERGHLILFFDKDWNRMDDISSFGHDIESAWLLNEAAIAIGDPALIVKTRKAARKIIDLVIEEGIDKDGGLMYEYNHKTNEFDQDKHWWVQAEALVGLYNGYELSRNEKYLESLLRIWEFTEQHIIDHAGGEWFHKVDKNGKAYPGMEKAGFWKCPYHNTRSMIELLGRIPDLNS